MDIFEYIAGESVRISGEQLALTVVAATSIFLTVIMYTRIAGLRSFSKMSSFDFAMTVAVGSLIATIAVAQVSFVRGAVALATLYLVQIVIARLRRRTSLQNLVDNQPLLLMCDGKMIDANMRRSRVTRADILSKLREANVQSIGSVHAVVFETTGDITVLHGDGTPDSALLKNVRR